jgi:dihydrofolate synthase/folylpolyglutamate synthase
MIDALDQFFPEKRIIFVFAVMADKDHRSMLREISRKAKFVVLTKPEYKRAAEPESLKETLEKEGIAYEIIPQVKQAYVFALKKAQSGDVICVTGSHFTVGEFLGSTQNV